MKGVRPLGGGIEFGKSARHAVIREFREELHLDIEVRGDPVVMENLYVHEGAPGHEVLFVFDVAFPAGAFDGQDRILFHEDDGSPCLARWHDLADLDIDGGPALTLRG